MIWIFHALYRADSCPRKDWRSDHISRDIYRRYCINRKCDMKYNHNFTCQILLLHRNKGRNGLHFGYFKGCKTALSKICIVIHCFRVWRKSSLVHRSKLSYQLPNGAFWKVKGDVRDLPGGHFVIGVEINKISAEFRQMQVWPVFRLRSCAFTRPRQFANDEQFRFLSNLRGPSSSPDIRDINFAEKCSHLRFWG
jgi:hypothetical protein